MVLCLLMAGCSIPTHSFCRTTRQPVPKAIAMSAIIERTAGELRGSITHLHKDGKGEVLRIHCEYFFQNGTCVSSCLRDQQKNDMIVIHLYVYHCISLFFLNDIIDS